MMSDRQVEILGQLTNIDMCQMPALDLIREQSGNPSGMGIVILSLNGVESTEKRWISKNSTQGINGGETGKYQNNNGPTAQRLFQAEFELRCQILH